MRMTEGEYAALIARSAGHHAKARPMPALPPALVHDERRNSPHWPYRSKTEQQYAALLESQKRQGFIEYWSYEPIRLRLAPATTLTVDFLVQEYKTDQELGLVPTLQFHEVKGGWYREDGWQKLKIAAALYPMFRFYRVQWKDNNWHYLEVPSA